MRAFFRTGARMLGWAFLLGCPALVCGADYAIGADRSFLRQAEPQGTVFDRWNRR